MTRWVSEPHTRGKALELSVLLKVCMSLVVLRHVGIELHLQCGLQGSSNGMFLPFLLFTSSLRCVCVVHALSLLAQVVQSVEKHTLGTRFCHNGSRTVGRRDSHLTIRRSVQQAYW